MHSLPFCSASCNTNTLVAAGDEKGSIRLMDSAVNEDFRTPHVNFKVHSNAIMDMAFSADDYLLASASGDQTARVVDMHTQQVLAILSGHGSSVKQIRFQPNTDNIITTSARDGTVKVWDLRSGELGSVASLRVSQRRFLNEDGVEEPSVRYCNEGILVGPAHRSVNGVTTSPSILKSEDSSVSITSIQHLPNGREHLLLTASELSASVKLWDLRNARSRSPVALAATPLPETHRKTRNFGLSSMMLSGDGARLYTLCKDATVYAYSTNQILLGAAPEMSNGSRRRAPKETKVGLGPLYAFRHPALRTETFYVKSSMRPARGDGSEILAVGSSSGCAVLFPTDERHFKRPQRDDEDSDDEDDMPSLTRKLARASTSSLPVYQQGTALIRGHTKEVTSMTWTYDGDLVTVADDFTTRVWREDAEQARHLRNCGEGGGQRWGMGWADVDAAWDQEEEGGRV
ncbi:WD40 repeat-like protein [Teratosphaeria nubilosa]|uniref:WD40 repeat-like protein n=1 Tax=Teratosphaeria nubilosa TaxID=161662 RepID=A0A6G1LNC6_9PEZI|nr:WD40 repeat-like protein [Teratosphaeria nubilosa]